MIRRLTLLLVFFIQALKCFALPIEVKTSTISDIVFSGESTKDSGSQIIVKTLSLGTTQNSRRLYIQGGLHGNEFLTSEFVEWLIARTIKGESLLNKLPEDVEIDLVAKANPASSERNNPRNVNLNRNFSVLWGVSTEPQGEKPFSESETRAISALFKKRKYQAAIDIHGYLNWVVIPSRPVFIEKVSPAYLAWQKLVTRNLAILPGYLVKTAGELGDGGAFEDWAYWEEETFALCLEMKRPFRYFSDGKIKTFDSFLAYEKFIYQMFDGALKLDRRKNQNFVGNRDNSIQFKTRISH